MCFSIFQISVKRKKWGFFVRETQNLVRERQNLEVEKDINVEVEDNDDLLFVPTVDVPASDGKNAKVKHFKPIYNSCRFFYSK